MSKLDLTTGYYHRVETRHGCFLFVFSEKGLFRIYFPGTFDRTNLSNAELKKPCGIICAWAEVAEKALTDHLNGIPPQKYPPYDLTDGTDFFIKVWEQLQKIEWGKTATYGEIAKKLGNSKLARAVGAACGANPIPIFIPCHRVIASNGSLGGFSAGLKWKKLLLEIESKNSSSTNR